MTKRQRQTDALARLLPMTTVGSDAFVLPTGTRIIWMGESWHTVPYGNAAHAKPVCDSCLIGTLRQFKDVAYHMDRMAPDILDAFGVQLEVTE